MQVPSVPVLPLAPQLTRDALFFPNPGHCRVRIEAHYPAAFASNGYGFGKCAEFQKNRL